MATQADKLSPIFKSLHPDEAPLANVATAVVKDAEQRWPLFRAIAPVRPPSAPVLTEDERVNRANSKISIGTQRAPALSLPGLNEQLAQGLSKMAGRKSTPRTGTRTKAKVPARAAVTPVASSQVAEEKPDQWTKSAVEVAPVVRPTPKVEPAPVAVLPPVRKPVLTEQAVRPAAPAAPVVRETVPPTPMAVPVKLAVAPTQLKPNPLSVSTAIATPQQQPAEQATAKISIKTQQVKVAAPAAPAVPSATESLKSLFSRLQAPPKDEIKVPAKKSSFLGRLARR